MIKDNVQILIEQKLHNIFNKIEEQTEIKYNDLYSYVNEEIFEIKNLKCKNNTDEVKNYLLYLLKFDKNYLIINNNLQQLKTNFKELCKKKNYNILHITDDFLQSIIVEYYEELISNN